MPGDTERLTLHHEQLAMARWLRQGRALADALDIAKGQRVLDLDCGCALLTDELAERVGPRGDVLGLDASPLRVHRAHQRFDRRQLRFQIGDVERLDRFPDGAFDVVVAHDAMHRWEDGCGKLGALRRLLSPGGRLGVSAPARAACHPVEGVLDEVMSLPPYARHVVPQRPAGLEVERLSAMLRDAGLADFRIEMRSERSRYPSAEVALAASEAESGRSCFDHLPVYLRAPARAEVVRRLEALGRLEHAATVLLVTARRLS